MVRLKKNKTLIIYLLSLSQSLFFIKKDINLIFIKIKKAFLLDIHTILYNIFMYQFPKYNRFF